MGNESFVRSEKTKRIDGRTKKDYFEKLRENIRKVCVGVNY